MKHTDLTKFVKSISENDLPQANKELKQALITRFDSYVEGTEIEQGEK